MTRAVLAVTFGLVAWMLATSVYVAATLLTGHTLNPVGIAITTAGAVTIAAHTYRELA